MSSASVRWSGEQASVGERGRQHALNVGREGDSKSSRCTDRVCRLRASVGFSSGDLNSGLFGDWAELRLEGGRSTPSLPPRPFVGDVTAPCSEVRRMEVTSVMYGRVFHLIRALFLIMTLYTHPQSRRVFSVTAPPSGKPPHVHPLQSDRGRRRTGKKL